ncbi:MAG: cobalamin-dependent protein [Ktedonobacteraceae bacterium]
MMGRGGFIEKPDLEAYSDTPMFNTKSVVQQTGVPGPTLRAWERRYTLLSPERAHNTYRLYSERDIVMIRWLKERVDAGMAISQAIALFRHQDDEGQSENPPRVEQTQVQHDKIFNSAPVTTAPDVSLNGGSARDEHRHILKRQAWQKPSTGQTQVPFPTIYSMRLVQERLVEVFNLLDESQATMIMGSMLAIYPLDQVCTELITPTMWQIGQLWADGVVTVSVEHFATNFFRALLTNLLQVTLVTAGAPTAIVCCAPGEQHELAPLMLSLFLRRSGIRVVYLGQNIEIEGLLQSVQQVVPALLCVSLTMPAYLSAVIDLAHQIEALPPPRPIFAFGGQVFAYDTRVISHIPGVYLAGELKTVVAQLRNTIVK